MNNQQDPFSSNQSSYDPSQANGGSYGNDDQRYSPQNQSEQSPGQQYSPQGGQDYPTQQYNQQQGYPGGDYPTQQYAQQNYPPQGGYDAPPQQYGQQQGYPGGDYPPQQYGQQNYPGQSGYPPTDGYPGADQDGGDDDKKPVYKQPWFFIVIGLIVALIIGGIILAFTMGGGDKKSDDPKPTKTTSSTKAEDPTDDPSPTETTKSPKPEPTTEDPEPGDGELAALTLSVIDTKTSPTKPENAFSDKQIDSKAGEFVWVKVGLKNTGKKPLTIMSMDFKMDVDGKTFKSESDILEDPDGELSELVFEINPDTTEEGWILFDVPSGASDRQIYVEDTFGDGTSAKISF